MSLFDSRWVQAPAHVSELAAGGGLPEGFRAGGLACGIKPSGRFDLGLLICDAPEPVSAVRLTSSLAPAAPVQLTRRRCRLASLRAVLANSGCANAGTGARGLDDAARCQGAAAAALSVDPAAIAVASTGSISDHLPVDLMLKGMLRLRTQLRRDGDGDFQRAIMTTDATAKQASLLVELPGGPVRLSAQCKGAGMISPRFATMLCFIETDALLRPQVADALLGEAVAGSFDRISVDGQLSTNDTVAMIASGLSGIRADDGGEGQLRFAAALGALLRALAIMIVADGEGAKRIARVRVRGGADPAQAERAARAIANSPLVKAALHGGDPNWGRILQALAGELSADAAAVQAASTSDGVLEVGIAIEGVKLCERGAGLAFDERALAAAVQAAEVEYEVQLPGEGAVAEVIFSDLSPEYASFNAKYTT